MSKITCDQLGAYFLIISFFMRACNTLKSRDVISVLQRGVIGKKQFNVSIIFLRMRFGIRNATEKRIYILNRFILTIFCTASTCT